MYSVPWHVTAQRGEMRSEDRYYVFVPGYGKENIGRNAKFLQGPMTEGYMVEEIMEALRHADPLFCKLQNHKPDGSVYQLCLCLTPIFNVDGESCQNLRCSNCVTNIGDIGMVK